jgi:RNA polymerase sigma-70 factor (ECF subfamily)
VPSPSPAPPAGSGSSQPLDPTSQRLLFDARRGSTGALEQLVSRYLPQLVRWAHGRLPRWARTASDTSDLIQDVLLRTLRRRLDQFEPQGRRALAAYLREAVLNRIRDEHRRVARWGVTTGLPEHIANPQPSPLDHALAAETETRYRAALKQLGPRDRALVVAHVELDYTHEQLGCMIGRSPNAARMALRRAIGRLAECMRKG